MAIRFVERTAGCFVSNIFDYYTIDVGQFVEPTVDYMAAELRPLFQVLKLPFGTVLDLASAMLVNVRPEVMLVLIFLLAWQIASLRVAVWSTIGLLFVGFLGIWQETMITLGLVVTSVLFSVLLGIPVGIIMAKMPVVGRVARPILDTMQTLPAFVYLIPIVVMFGIGNVAGVIVTIIYAIPPVVRLTCLGITSVPADLSEAADAYGASSLQKLRRVELPVAMPTIMAGVNQTIMMALGMSVYSSMIAVKGLGLLVLRGIGSMDLSLAVIGGTGIVVLAMILDRLSESVFIEREKARAAAGSKPVDHVRYAIRRLSGGSATQSRVPAV